jgi:putative ABC transport system substrate-binding protein
MKRRAFITLLGGAATWPLAARAQQTKIARLGFVSWQAPTRIEDLRQGLRELGYVEGKNIEIEVHFVDGDRERAQTPSGRFSKRASISLSCGQHLQHTSPRR